MTSNSARVAIILMPNCFTLTRITDPKAGPVKLQEIDAEMCKHFNVPCDDTNWYNGWYYYIGFMLAIGKSWKWLEDDMLGECLRSPYNSPAFEYWSINLDILNWLKANFTQNAWYECK